MILPPLQPSLLLAGTIADSVRLWVPGKNITVNDVVCIYKFAVISVNFCRLQVETSETGY